MDSRPYPALTYEERSRANAPRECTTMVSALRESAALLIFTPVFPGSAAEVGLESYERSRNLSIRPPFQW